MYAYLDSDPVTGTDPDGLAPGWHRLLPSMARGARWGPIGVCGGLAYWYTTDIIKPAIDDRNRTTDEDGDPRFRRPSNPQDPWDWADGTSWERQRNKWREKRRPRCSPRPVDPPPCFTHNM